MYRITYEQGNGYRCGCCRQTTDMTHDCETREEVIDWLSHLQACKDGYQDGIISNDSDDRKVIEINETGPDIRSEFKADPEITKRYLEGFRKKKKEDEEYYEKEEEERDKQEYERLKEIYGSD